MSILNGMIRYSLEAENIDVKYYYNEPYLAQQDAEYPALIRLLRLGADVSQNTYTDNITFNDTYLLAVTAPVELGDDNEEDLELKLNTLLASILDAFKKHKVIKQMPTEINYYRRSSVNGTLIAEFIAPSMESINLNPTC